MRLVILNEKIRKKNGDLQPIEYKNAAYEIVGDLVVVKHDGNLTTKIPREHVAQIMEFA